MPYDFENEGVGFMGLEPAPEVRVVTEKADRPVDDLLLEAERRFEKARYYEVLIKEPIFEGDNSPLAAEVIGEIQRFARERLTILLGLRSEAPVAAPEGVFSDEEVKILKVLAAKLLRKPEVAGLPVSANPTLKKARGPKRPTVVAAKSPVAPTGQNAAPATPAPKPEPAAGSTGEVMKIPQKDGTYRTYKKAVESDGKEVYYGENGNRYVLATNSEGEYYMKSASRQARPVGIKPLQRPNEQAMLMLASQQVQSAMKQDPVAGTITPEFLK